jgi:hypothetical protein
VLQWPSRAGRAIRKLFEPLQDIDVYVEDANDEAFYRALLNFATGEEIKISRVFALGGREAVLSAARQHDFSKRRALFIIDGDLLWASGSTGPFIRGIHQHQAYCVENLLFCEQAITTILSQDLAANVDDAKELLAYEQWRSIILPPLVELFAAYVASYINAPTLPTVSRRVGPLCAQLYFPKRTELDVTKVKDLVNEVLSLARSASSQEKVDSSFGVALARLQALPDPFRAISGKDYLFPLLHFKLQATGIKTVGKSLRYRMACCGDRTRFASLSNALRGAASNS